MIVPGMSDAMRSVRDEVVRLFATKAAKRYGFKAEVARLTGVTSQSVGGWASGRNVPTPDHWEKLAEAFGLDPGHFALIEAGHRPELRPPSEGGESTVGLIERALARLEDLNAQVESLAGEVAELRSQVSGLEQRPGPSPRAAKPAKRAPARRRSG